MASLAAMVLAGCGGGATSGGPTRVPATPTAAAIPHMPQSSLRNAGAPPARYGAAIAFDPVSKELILFGGATTGDQPHPGDPSRLADTWAWDGKMWTQLHPAVSPPSLYGARMVLDPISGHLLLISGSGQLDSNSLLLQQGTWSWDGQNWSRTGDTPLQMPFAVAGADAQHRQVLLSGFDNNYPTQCGGRLVCPVLAPIDKPGAYMWDGSHWVAAAGKAPEWSAAGTALDPNTGQVISAGGVVSNGLQSTYGWNGKQWDLVSQSQGSNGVPDPDYPAGPCDAATDVDAGHIVMTCAFTTNGNATGATWTFDGSTWSRAQQATTTLPAIPSLSLADDPVAAAVVMAYPGPGGTEAMRLWNGSDWTAIPAS
jgi:hypothetical protein